MMAGLKRKFGNAVVQGISLTTLIPLLALPSAQSIEIPMVSQRTTKFSNRTGKRKEYTERQGFNFYFS